jgi:hypothetical protein
MCWLFQQTKATMKDMTRTMVIIKEKSESTARRSEANKEMRKMVWRGMVMVKESSGCVRLFTMPVVSTPCCMQLAMVKLGNTSVILPLSPSSLLPNLLPLSPSPLTPNPRTKLHPPNHPHHTLPPPLILSLHIPRSRNLLHRSRQLRRYSNTRAGRRSRLALYLFCSSLSKTV